MSLKLLLHTVPHRDITLRHSQGKQRCSGCCSNPTPTCLRYILLRGFFVSRYIPPLPVPFTCHIFSFNCYELHKISTWFPIRFPMSYSNLSLLICYGRKVWTEFRQPLCYDPNIFQIQFSTNSSS